MCAQELFPGKRDRTARRLSLPVGGSRVQHSDRDFCGAPGLCERRTLARVSRTCASAAARRRETRRRPRGSTIVPGPGGRRVGPEGPPARGAGHRGQTGRSSAGGGRCWASPMTGPPGEEAHTLHNPEAVAAFSKLLKDDERARKSARPLLTAAGRQYVLRYIRTAEDDSAVEGISKSKGRPSSASAPLPRWDANERRLWLGRVLLKEFRQPAPNQTALLDAFQAHSWTRKHLADPLPREAGESDPEAQQRLHDAIKCLNRAMPRGTIHFRGDGSARGVWWEYAGQEGLEPQSSANKPKC